MKLWPVDVGEAERKDEENSQGKKMDCVAGCSLTLAVYSSGFFFFFFFFFFLSLLTAGSDLFSSSALVSLLLC